MKRNPDVKDFLLRPLCWYNVGIKTNGKQNDKRRGKGVVPFRQLLLNAMKLLLTGLITVIKNKTFYDRLLLDKWQSITGKLRVKVNEFEIVITQWKTKIQMACT